MFIYREDRDCRILIRTVTFIIIAVFLCENAVWASPELLQPSSAFQKESKNNRGALVQMKGACRYVKECRKLSEDDDNPKALQELKGKNKEAEGRDIGGNQVEHGTKINPRLASWIRDNRVVDYYYEEGRWVPHRVKYIEDIASGEIGIGSSEYYDEQGNPIDKGDQIADSKQLSDEEQRRLNEALQLCGYDELGKPVRFRVVLGETAAAWTGELDHSSLVHAGRRSATVWFGEGLFRNLLSRDYYPLRGDIFSHEKRHLEGREGIDEGAGYEDLVSRVRNRCISIDKRRKLHLDSRLKRGRFKRRYEEYLSVLKIRIEREMVGRETSGDIPSVLIGIDMDRLSYNIASNIIRVALSNKEVCEEWEDKRVLPHENNILNKVRELVILSEDDIRATIGSVIDLIDRARGLGGEAVIRKIINGPRLIMSRLLLFIDVYDWLQEEIRPADQEEREYLARVLANSAYQISWSKGTFSNALTVSEIYESALGRIAFQDKILRKQWLIAVYEIAMKCQHGSLEKVIELYNNNFGDIRGIEDTELRKQWLIAVYAVAMNCQHESLEKVIELYNNNFGDISGIEDTELRKQWLIAVYAVAMNCQHGSLEKVIELYNNNFGDIRGIGDTELRKQWLVAVYNVAMECQQESLEKVIELYNNNFGDIRGIKDTELRKQWLIAVYEVAMKCQQESLEKVIELYNNNFGDISGIEDTELRKQWLIAVYEVAMNCQHESLEKVIELYNNNFGDIRGIEDIELRKQWLIAVYEVAMKCQQESLEKVIELYNNNFGDIRGIEDTELRKQWLIAVYAVAMNCQHGSLEKVIELYNNNFGDIRGIEDTELRKQWLIAVYEVAMKCQHGSLKKVIELYNNNFGDIRGIGDTELRKQWLVAVYNVAMARQHGALGNIFNWLLKGDVEIDFSRNPINWLGLIWRLAYLDKWQKFVSGITSRTQGSEELSSWFEAMCRRLDNEIFAELRTRKTRPRGRDIGGVQTEHRTAVNPNGNHSVDEEDGYQHLVEEVHRRRIQIECVIERNPELELPRSNDEQICAVKERVKDEIFGEYELIKESEATLQRDGLDYEVYRVSVYTIKNIAGSRPQLIRGETLKILGTVLRRAGLYRDIYEETGYAVTKIVKNRPDLSWEALQALEACLQQEGLDSYACLCAMNAITNIVDNKPELIRRSTLQVLETTLKRDELYRGTYWKAAYIIGNMALDRPELYVKALEILETCLLHEGLPGCACEAVSFAVRDIVKKRPELIRGSTIRALRITLGRDGLSTNTCGAVAYALKGIAEKKPELSEEVLPGLGDALLCDELVDDDRRDTVCAIRKIAQSRPELAEEALRVLVNVFQRKGFDNDVLITIGSIMPLASDRIDRDYLLSILNMCKLCRIGFHDGGSAVNNFSGLAEGILMGGNAAEIKEDTSFVPEFKQSDIQQLNEQDNIDNFIVDYELAKDIPHAEGGVLGRTLIYRHKRGGTYLGLKLLKKGEDAGALVYESEMLQYINNNYTGLGLMGRYPEPVLIVGNRIVRVKELPEDVLDTLKAQRAKEGEVLELDNMGGYYTLMAYRVNNKDYFTYLNNEDIEEEKFEEAVLTNIRDLVSLARAGIIHTALIELFHNVARPDRPDLGRYLWMVDIVGLGNIYITTGTGRLHNWEGAVRYPNLRLSGLADFADTALLDYMVDNPRYPGCVHLLNVEDRIENEELLKKIYLANFLGDYLLSAALILGSRMKRRGEFNWEDPVRLAGFIKRVFNTAYKEFTGRGPGILDESIDWNMLARQMSYFMSSAYVEDFRPELRAEEQERRLREKKIYAEDTDIGFGDYREESWSDEVGWTGFLLDGRSDNQPALGPVNGPLPLQELVRALYFYAAFMVTDILQKPDASTTQEDNARRFVNRVKGEGVRQKGKRIILALDTDIGNVTQFEINEMLKQIGDVCSLLGDIEFVAGSGEELPGAIDKKIADLIIRMKIEIENIDVVIITKREKGDFNDSFHVTRVDDTNLGDSGSYVPILELLTFALTINLREDDEILRKELRGIYNEITGKELTGELIEEIKKGTFAIELPQTERIPLDFYNESTEILRSA